MNTTPNPRATNNSNGVFDEFELPCLSLSGVGMLVEEVVEEDITPAYHATALGVFSLDLITRALWGVPKTSISVAGICRTQCQSTGDLRPTRVYLEPFQLEMHINKARCVFEHLR